MSLFSISNSYTKKAGLLLDVGSNSVGGAIYEELPSGENKLLYSTREQISFNKTLNGDLLLNSMVRAVGMVLLHIEKYGLKHVNKNSKEKYQIDSASVVLSSPWYISETKNLSVRHDKPFLITDTVIGDLITKEENSFRESMKVGKKTESDMTLLEHKITDVSLNGYATTNPYGKIAQSIDLKFCTCLMPKHVSEKIEAQIHKTFPVKDTHFHAFASVFMTEIMHLFDIQQDLVLVSIGGEVTDIVMASAGNIVESVSLPLGHNNFLRSLDKVCQKHTEGALQSLMSLYHDKKLGKGDIEKVEEAIEDTRLSWSELFLSSSKGFLTNNYSKKTICVFEDTPNTYFFEKFIEKAIKDSGDVSVDNIEIQNGDAVAAKLNGVQDSISADVHLAVEIDYLSKHKKSVVK